MLQVAMLSTGEEVLHGDICDTNAAWFAARCFEQGFALHRKVTVGDGLEAIGQELIRCSEISDVVIVNGGLGPTGDDVTTAAMAAVMQVPLVLDKGWLDNLHAYYAKRNVPMPDSNIKQAMLPQGAKRLENPIGTACGFAIEFNQCWFFFTPGVPREFYLMAEQQIFPRLKQRFSPLPKCIKRFFVFGVGESILSDKLDTLKLGADLTLGYRAQLPFIEVKLMSDNALAAAIVDEIRGHLQPYLVAEDTPFMPAFGHILTTHAVRLGICENFSFGALTHWLAEEQTTQQAVMAVKVEIEPQSLAFTADDDSLLMAADNAAASTGAPDPQLQMQQALMQAQKMRAKAAKKTAQRVIGLCIGENRNHHVAVAMVAEDKQIAVFIGPARNITLAQSRDYCCTIALELVRRYLVDNLAPIPPISAVKLLDSIINN